jgi:cell division protein ZapA (FtsZ GTPase activity inhibitor)
MNKLQIKIRNRSYTLRTDENPDRIQLIANELDEKIADFTANLKGMPEHEILTLVAYSLMEELDKTEDEFKRLKECIEKAEEDGRNQHTSAAAELEQIFALKEKENNDLRERVRDFEKMWDAHTSKLYGSAADELNQLAKRKEQEMSELHHKLHEYERTWSDWVKTNRSETEDEFYKMAASKEQESAELFVKLVEYEKVWDTHAMEVYNSAIAEAREAAEGKELKSQKLEETLENFEKMFDEYSKRKEDEIIRLQEENESLKLKLRECSDGQIMLV